MAAITATVGLVVLGGHLWHIAAIVQIRPTFPPMQVNVALGLLVSAAGLGALARGRARLAAGCGIVTALLGTATGLQYLLEADFGIDRLLAEPLVNARTLHPARMAPNAALGFALTGLAMVFLALRRRAEGIPAVLAAFVGTIAVSSLVGYYGGVNYALLWTTLTPMAVHTAFAFNLVSAGLLALSWDRDVSSGHGSFGALAVPAATMVAATCVLLAVTINAREKTEELRGVQSAITAVESRVLDEVNHRRQALRLMARRWSIPGSIPSDAWRDDALQFEREHGSLGLAIVVRGSPAPSIVIDHGREKLDVAALRPALADLPNPGSETIRTARSGSIGGARLSMILPLDGSRAGSTYLVGVFDVAAMLRGLLRHGVSDYAVEIAAGGENVYRHTDSSTGPPLEASRRLAEPLADWQIRIWPTADGPNQPTTWMAEVVAIIGLMLSILIVLTLRLVDRMRAAAAVLEQTHERLRVSEERLNLAVTGSQDTIWDFDDASEHLFFSERLDEILGYDPGELERSFAVLLDHVHPDDRKPTLRALDAHLKQRAPYDIEYRLRAKSGGYHWFRARGQAVWDDTGRFVRMAGSVTWIDDRKAAAEELLIARDAALDATRAKSEFLATMSHEIRTPLNGIIGAAGLLTGTNTPEEERDLTSIITDSAKGLLAIINDILDFSKIEARKLDIEAVPFDLHATAAMPVTTLGHAARSKGIALTCEIAPDVPRRVVGDPGRLRQILVNLVGNAIKFTDHGSVTLRALRAAGTDDRQEIRFEVVDTGIGVAPEVQTHLFQAFSQADGSTTRCYGGTGLGLAICDRLAALMGGSVGVSSRQGEGSTFWLRVPLATAEATEASDVAPRADPVAAGASPPTAIGPRWHAGDRGRVLMAEDNGINQKVLRRQLESMGYGVDIASNGSEAVRAVAATLYRAVLMDCQMPVMDGFAATAAIRKLAGAHGRVPVIAMTANVMTGDRERCLAVGMNDYVSKPVSLPLLEAALSRWIVESDDTAADPATVATRRADALARGLGSEPLVRT